MCKSAIDSIKKRKTKSTRHDRFFVFFFLLNQLPPIYLHVDSLFIYNKIEILRSGFYIEYFKLTIN